MKISNRICVKRSQKGVRGQDGMFFRRNPEIVVGHVTPDFLHVVPICDDTVLNGILQRQHTALTQQSRQTRRSWTDVIMFVAQSVQGSGPRVRGSLSRRRRYQTDKSSGQQLPRECRPSLDSSRCTCRPLASSSLHKRPPGPRQEAWPSGECGQSASCRCSASTCPLKQAMGANRHDHK